MDANERRELINKYKEGYQAVADALHGINEEELDVRPAPGKWSPREISIAYTAMSGSAPTSRLTRSGLRPRSTRAEFPGTRRQVFTFMSPPRRS